MFLRGTAAGLVRHFGFLANLGEPADWRSNYTFGEEPKDASETGPTRDDDGFLNVCLVGVRQRFLRVADDPRGGQVNLRQLLPIHVPSSGGLLAGLVGFQNP